MTTFNASGTFGPFSVSAEQVAALGLRFGAFVNELLSVELATVGFSRADLRTTYRENIGDEGVDAGLTSTDATEWIPAGESAWQFKAGDLEPAQCKAELKGATRALEILRRGGTYRLVLGASLTEAKIERRQNALEEQARELGITVVDGMFKVLTADDLARWTSQYPALAVAPLLGGIGYDAQTFDEWSNSSGHTATWVNSPARASVIEEIHRFVATADVVDFRVRGESGLGKTRVVMEAFRDHPHHPLLVHIYAADSMQPGLFNHLVRQHRTAIIVIDECDGKRAKSLADLIPAGAPIKLITIGEVERGRGPDIELAPLSADDIDQVLKTNQPTLSTEARRVVIEVAAGNVSYALALSNAIATNPRASASQLITADDLKQYFTDVLPGGSVFLGCSALALFSSIGFDAEVSVELELVADALSISLADLRAAASDLRQLGLLSEQGRFRAVTPHPVAVFLATAGWKEFGDRITSSLLPALGPEMAERLFRRAADIGEFAPTRRAVTQLLGAAGPFASLEAIAEGRNGRLLTQLAIVAPQETCAHLTEIIGAATEEELSFATEIRRDLVWTLEKLVWHTETFEAAADALLRLALAENETFGNNATGTWVELFGTMLPGTAAAPDIRLAYLQQIAGSADPRERELAGKAAARALSVHETIMVSGEVQGGVVVETRGTPKTNEELWSYQEAAIRLLTSLASDSSPVVAEAALEALIWAIHPYLESGRFRPLLASAFTALGGEPLRRARTEVEHLKELFERVSDVEDRKAGLQEFVASLPPLDSDEELEVLAHGKRWDFAEGELERRITEICRPLGEDQVRRRLLGLLDSEIEAAYEVGLALAELVGADRTVASRLVGLATGPNGSALVGYLWGTTERGTALTFDSFLDEGAGRALEPSVRLGITVRGPQTEAGWERVMSLVGELSVVEAARGLFGWHIDLDLGRLRQLLESWSSRISTQVDYNAVVDFAAMALYRRPEWIDEVDPLVAGIVDRRMEFPGVGQQAYDWIQLARRRLEQAPDELLDLLLADVEGGGQTSFHVTQEAEFFREVLGRVGSSSFGEVMQRVVDGNWRLQMAVRGWLPDLYDASVVTGWIGDNLGRARHVASVLSPGDTTAKPAARYLLETFGDDERIAAELFGNYFSGSWSGSMSAHLAGQINQLTSWSANPSESAAVKRWARRAIADLTAQREAALQREAEGGF